MPNPGFLLVIPFPSDDSIRELSDTGRSELSGRRPSMPRITEMFIRCSTEELKHETCFTVGFDELKRVKPRLKQFRAMIYGASVRLELPVVIVDGRVLIAHTINSVETGASNPVIQRTGASQVPQSLADLYVWLLGCEPE